MSDEKTKRKSLTFLQVVALPVIILAYLIVFVVCWPAIRWTMTNWGVDLAMIGVVVGAAAFTYICLLSVYFDSNRELGKNAVEEAEKLQEHLGDDFFGKLVQINFRYIEAYYYQTQAHAQKSFVVSVVASLVGLATIATGICLMFFKDKELTGAVTVSAGVLSEFISAVFFYLYSGTVRKMSEYHRKLVITQNVAIALKVADTLPDPEKNKAKQKIIAGVTRNVNRYLAGPATAKSRQPTPQGSSLRNEP